MTTKSNIIDGKFASSQRSGLVYTNKCGWVDLGHARPDGARDLWKSIANESGKQCEEKDYHLVSYSQRMGAKRIFVGVAKKFKVKKSLPLEAKKSVALSIYLNVSKTFENMQANAFFRLFTDSGFSNEDLISDLIGFYRAVDPKTDYIARCEPQSKELALAIWDRFGPVGRNKNRTFSPYFYSLNPSSKAPVTQGYLPDIFQAIKPAPQGKLFREVQ